MFWGITPALDLLHELKSNGNLPPEINILLIGSIDLRHVLKTIARKHRYEQVNVNFYIMEPISEIIAKQLLLLYIATEPVKEFGTNQKTRTFMELFGNTIIRPNTARYLTSVAKDFVEMITNFDYLKQVMPFVNVDLKYKERDYMENVFKFWTSNDQFDICDAWDRRLRKYLGVRYDTRIAAFDWDLHMGLYHVGAEKICSQEYQSFRRNGVAFTWLESEVSKPNRTMVTGLITNGDNFGHYGYLGDMNTGPFIAYGIECDDPEFLSKTNNMNKHRSTDITERNLREIFHELEFGEKYQHQKTHDLSLGASQMLPANISVVDTGNVTVTKRKLAKSFDINNITINFKTINSLKLMLNKNEWKNFFHLIYYANSYLKFFLVDVLMHIAVPKCLLIIENQKFVPSYREKELEEHYENIKQKLDGSEYAACPFDYNTDSYCKYVLKA